MEAGNILAKSNASKFGEVLEALDVFVQCVVTLRSRESPRIVTDCISPEDAKSVTCIGHHLNSIMEFHGQLPEESPERSAFVSWCLVGIKTDVGAAAARASPSAARSGDSFGLQAGVPVGENFEYFTCP